MAAERCTVRYSGRVQGVGFRWMTQRALEGALVTGYVRNLRDGRVELVLEGTPEQVADGLQRVRVALGHHIQAEEQSTGPATAEFPAFGIRR